MSQERVPELPDYESLKEALPAERKVVVKLNSFGEDEENEFVRSLEDAYTIFDFIMRVQTQLHRFFKDYPSLLGLFKNQFISFSEFIDRNNIIEMCFLYDCLFPEKEMYFFGQDGEVSGEILKLNEESLENWCESAKQDHLKTQNRIREEFSSDDKFADMECQCLSCMADFRTKLRESLFNECKTLVKDTEEKLRSRVHEGGIEELSQLYHEMQRSLEKKFHDSRKRLKRSTLNRLENQITNIVKDTFYYPAELGKIRAENLKPFFKSLLVEEELNDDLVSDEEYERFFAQLSSNLWKGEKYLRREFKKLTKSVMLLKRKDISAKILKEYLGEFWVHSNARQMKRKIVYHMGPTNSGKTYHAIRRLADVDKGCYLAPLRLLAGELYDTLNSLDVKTTLLTGEEVIEVEGATHYSSTIEMARLHESFDCCVIDEIQMMNDNQRGWAWTRALVNIMAKEIHICGDPTVYDLVEQIVELCGDELEVQNYERMTDLKVENRPTTLGELQRSDALIVFSRRNALRYKADLERLGFKVSIVYGRLSPEVRREQARKFDQKETDIIVSTDAIAMGMNLPIRRIVFSTLSKFINNQEYRISYSEIKQIAGRAGRYQRFPTGYVNCLSKVREGLDDIRAAMSDVLPQKEKCMVGPDLDIFNQVNAALRSHNLPELKLSEFLRLFNTMTFQKPFYCVDLREMIEITEMVEESDTAENLSSAEIFGFACAPVNLGLMDHVEFFVWIVNNYVRTRNSTCEPINSKSDDIDYLETSIKCVELFQWLSRHFNDRHFDYNLEELLENKGEAIEQLNGLLSEKTVRKCPSCGVKLPEDFQFPICEDCFQKRKFKRKSKGGKPKGGKLKGGKPGGKGGWGKNKGKNFKGKNIRPKRKKRMKNKS